MSSRIGLSSCFALFSASLFHGNHKTSVFVNNKTSLTRKIECYVMVVGGLNSLQNFCFLCEAEKRKKFVFFDVVFLGLVYKMGFESGLSYGWKRTKNSQKGTKRVEKSHFIWKRRAMLVWVGFGKVCFCKL